MLHARWMFLTLASGCISLVSTLSRLLKACETVNFQLPQSTNFSLQLDRTDWSMIFYRTPFSATVFPPPSTVLTRLDIDRCTPRVGPRSLAAAISIDQATVTVTIIESCKSWNYYSYWILRSKRYQPSTDRSTTEMPYPTRPYSPVVTLPVRSKNWWSIEIPNPHKSYRIPTGTTISPIDYRTPPRSLPYSPVHYRIPQHRCRCDCPTRTAAAWAPRRWAATPAIALFLLLTLFPRTIVSHIKMRTYSPPLDNREKHEMSRLMKRISSISFLCSPHTSKCINLPVLLATVWNTKHTFNSKYSFFLKQGCPKCPKNYPTFLDLACS